MTSSQSVFRSVFLYFLLALLFARYSPLYLCLFLFSFAFLSPYSAYFGVLSNFLARFSRIALRLLLLVFSWSLGLLLFILFSPKTLSPQTWIRTVSSRGQSFSSSGILALRVDQKLQNTENFCSTSISSVWFPAQNAACKLFAYAASYLLAHVKPSCNA